MPRKKLCDGPKMPKARLLELQALADESQPLSDGKQVVPTESRHPGAKKPKKGLQTRQSIRKMVRKCTDSCLKSLNIRLNEPVEVEELDELTTSSPPSLKRPRKPQRKQQVSPQQAAALARAQANGAIKKSKEE